MGKKPAHAIQPTRAEDYPEWYQQVIRAADLAETSAVRGCMVIKPWGYAIWERMQRILDDMFKETGHVNAYFPLFIPMSYMEKEAEHVEGFAKECAVVTHTRLSASEEGGLVPDSPLDEPLIVRPTSETIIGATYAKWVQSYRDLPILINQWANVVRWEMRTRMFLRTTEFLWQEGHTAHATEQEAVEETERMLEVYARFSEGTLAIPVIKGEKTAEERFPGAVATYAIESMMQDGKALQAGTSHFLGQNFSKAAGISFLNKEGQDTFAWTTSWGVTTRMIGGLIMTHADDDGLVLPPRVAPHQVVILPIYRNDEERAKVLPYCESLKQELQGQMALAEPVRVSIDDRDLRGGEKTWQHIKKGVPIRCEVGPRDMDQNAAFVGRRDRAPKDKTTIARSELVANCGQMLEEIQNNLFTKAKKYQTDRTHQAKDLADMESFLEDPGGFVYGPWHEDSESSAYLKERKLSIRCLPIADRDKKGPCLFSGRDGAPMAVIAKSY